MPYVSVSTSQKLSQAQKDSLKTTLGEKISLIPGKTEAGLMVDISDGHSLYFAGKADDLAFVDIRCFGQTAPDAKKAYAAAVFEALEKQLGIPADHVYLNHTDLDTWGSRGVLRGG